MSDPFSSEDYVCFLLLLLLCATHRAIRNQMYDRLILHQQEAFICALVLRSQEQDEEILRRNRRLWDLELGSDKGTIVWKIEDFVRTSRKRVFMESPLLKTSPQGYAVRLNVHFEGDQGQRLSFSLRVQKGEHDGALEWPFRPVIRIGIITAFDQPLKFEKELDFKEADLSQIVGLQQPVSEENPKIDLVAIQTSEILERGCLVEGTLWIECTIQS